MFMWSQGSFTFIQEIRDDIQRRVKVTARLAWTMPKGKEKTLSEFRQFLYQKI